MRRKLSRATYDGPNLFRRKVIHSVLSERLSSVEILVRSNVGVGQKLGVIPNGITKVYTSAVVKAFVNRLGVKCFFPINDLLVRYWFPVVVFCNHPTQSIGSEHPGSNAFLGKTFHDASVKPLVFALDASVLADLGAHVLQGALKVPQEPLTRRVGCNNLAK